MATFKKLASGRWQAQIARAGKRASQTFDTKRDAKDWASRQEYLFLNPVPVGSDVLLRDVFDRYAREVSVLRKGEDAEVVRLNKFGSYNISNIPMDKLSASDFSNWRDRRLKEVSPASVTREMCLMSAVLNLARKEWGLIQTNPIADIRKPAAPPPRDRVVTDSELEALSLSAGSDLNKAKARVFHAFLFACETALLHKSRPEGFTA